MLPSAPVTFKIWGLLHGFIDNTVPQQWKDTHTYPCAKITCIELLSLSLYFWKMLGKCHLKQFPMSSINVSYTLINNARSLMNVSVFCSVFLKHSYQMTWMSLMANPELFSVYRSIVVMRVLELLFSTVSSTSCTSSEMKKVLLLLDFLATETWFMSKDKKMVDRLRSYDKAAGIILVLSEPKHWLFWWLLHTEVLCMNC